MTSPANQWPALFEFFDALHQDFDVEFAGKDECLDAALSAASTAEVKAALQQWHEAFDSADDGRAAEIIANLNPWWDADAQFGGHRQWAEWVREHLEAELARRTPR